MVASFLKDPDLTFVETTENGRGTSKIETTVTLQRHPPNDMNWVRSNYDLQKIHSEFIKESGEQIGRGGEGQN